MADLPWTIAAATGRLAPNVIAVRKFGRGSVAAATPRDIWVGDGDLVWPAPLADVRMRGAPDASTSELAAGFAGYLIRS